jgi:hypothetical protein
MKNLFKIIFLSICSSLAFTFSLTLQGQTTAELQAEIDAIEVGAGLEANGTYEADTTSNYLTEATSLDDADGKLDAAPKTESYIMQPQPLNHKEIKKIEDSKHISQL